MNNKIRNIGVHLSISGGVHKSLERAMLLNINAIQIFLKGSTRWESPAYKKEQIDNFNKIRKGFANLKVFAHSSYLINLCSEGELLTKSINSLLDEIDRADLLKIDYIVIHPGSHKGIGETSGIRRISSALDTVFQKRDHSKVKILLETVAGQGTNIGYKFEHLRDILDYSKYSERLEVCIDTCHIFAAGYRISDQEGYYNTIAEFDNVVTLKKLQLIHINDSKKECGSRVDRHEHIGSGLIGELGFKLLLNDERLKFIPQILETPKFNEFEADKANLNKAYSLFDKKD